MSFRRFRGRRYYYGTSVYRRLPERMALDAAPLGALALLVGGLLLERKVSGSLTIAVFLANLVLAQESVL